VETDCPYLTPVPHRGKKNDPTYVIHTMRRLADVKGFEYDEFEAIMLENAKRIFALD
ncbi:MAG: TatD family hydrolase, partial [Oscillospiraceae bacterium]|nr:TatD family hydrolase [Oscillospiraceae bacterium]